MSNPGKVTLTRNDNTGVNEPKIYRDQISSNNPEITSTSIAMVRGSTVTQTNLEFPAYVRTTDRYTIMPQGGGSIGALGTRQNTISLETAWQTIKYENSTVRYVEVVRTTTGSVYELV